MHRPASFLAMVLFGGVGAAQTITIPNGLATTEGETGVPSPWGNGTGVLQQSIYDSSNFTAQGVVGPVVITRLRWRPDASIGRTWTNCSYLPATIRLSTCPLDQGSPSAT